MGAVALSDPAFWMTPERETLFARLRRESPVSWQQEPPTAWSTGGRGYWAVVRHRDVRAASRRPAELVSGLGTELFELPVEVAQAYSGMLNMDAPRHTRLRALVSSAFSRMNVSRLEERVRRHAGTVIDAVAPAGGCDFALDIAGPFPVAVICDLMGVPDSDRDEVARLSRISVPLGDAEYGTFDDALAAALSLIEYAKQLQRSRRAKPADDLLSALCVAEVEGERLQPDEIGSFSSCSSPRASRPPRQRSPTGWPSSGTTRISCATYGTVSGTSHRRPSRRCCAGPHR